MNLQIRLRTMSQQSNVVKLKQQSPTLKIK